MYTYMYNVHSMNVYVYIDGYSLGSAVRGTVMYRRPRRDEWCVRSGSETEIEMPSLRPLSLGWTRCALGTSVPGDHYRGAHRTFANIGSLMLLLLDHRCPCSTPHTRKRTHTVHLRIIVEIGS